MAIKDKNRNWEPKNARNMRNYLKNPNAVTGALYRQSEGKGLTDAQRQELRQMVAGEKYLPPDQHKGDPNVMTADDESILRQATKAYHLKQQMQRAAKERGTGKFKDALWGDIPPKSKREIEAMPPKPGNRPMPGGGRGFGRPGWGGRPPRPTWGAGSGVQPGSQPKKRQGQ